MKTISEFNEKWYGRLGKVIFIIFCVFLFLFSFVVPIGFLDAQSSYNPEKLQENITSLQQKKEKFNFDNSKKWQLINTELKDSYIFTNKLIEFFKKNNITQGKEIELYLQLLLAQNKVLENVRFCFNECGSTEDYIEQMFVKGYSCDEDECLYSIPDVEISKDIVKNLQKIIYEFPKKKLTKFLKKYIKALISI